MSTKTSNIKFTVQIMTVKITAFVKAILNRSLENVAKQN